MSRQVVRYSALGSVVVAAVLGIVYFCFLSGTQAEDNSADAGSIDGATTTAEASKPAAPDPLFTEQGEFWKQDRKDRAEDPFQRGRSTVVQSPYSDGEPGRFEPDPAANPLRSADEADLNEEPVGDARLTGGGAAAEDDTGPRSAAQATDPFGLRNNVGVAATAERANSKSGKGTSSTPEKSPASSTIKKASQKQPQGASSRRAASSAADTGALRAIDPAPLDASVTDDGRTATLERSGSIFDKPPRDLRFGPTTQGTGADNNGSLELNPGAGSMPPSVGVAKPGSQYGSIAPAETEATANLDDAQLQSIEKKRVHSPANSNIGPAPLDSRFGETNEAGPIRNTAITSTAEIAPNARAQRAGVAGQQGSARPGSRQVEGKQTPQVTIEKTAPEEIQVGKPARFELHIRNTGSVTAQNVTVRDVVPEGTQFVAANPPATPGVQGDLLWSLGALKPGEETVIEVELTPIAEGEIGSVALVTFDAEAGARSRATKPDLTVQVSTAKQVMIGQEVLLSIKIGNPGTGAATGIVIQEHVPPGLKHTAGAELEFEVGTLKPGETRELELSLTAAQAGRIVNRIGARGDGNLKADATCELEIIAPALEVSVEGPARRYLERQATYTVSVSNPGTATTKDIELVTRLPKGLKFVKANNAGHYDPQTHTVAWSLEELPPAETGTVSLTALPIEPGEQRLRAEGRARQGLTDEQEQITLVEGLAALLFEVVDVADPIEVKGETEYEIRIVNQGSKAADNVQLMAMLPPELKFVSAEGPTGHAVDGQRILFEPLGRLSPKADTTYRVAVQGLQPGDLRMKVQLLTDDMRQPVTKEESTRVYSDE